MGQRLIVATGNKNKMIEIRQILADVDLEILSMAEAGLHPDIEETGTTFAANAALKALTVAQASGQMAIADDSGLAVDCLMGEPGIYSARYMGEGTSYDLKNRTLIQRVNDFCRGFEAAGRAVGRTEGNEFLAEDLLMTAGQRGQIIRTDLTGRGGQGGRSDQADLQRRPGADAQGRPGEIRSARFVCACVLAWPDGRTHRIVGKMEGRIAYEQAGENGFGYDPIFYLPEYGKTSAQLLPEEKNAISHRGQAFRAMHDYLAELLG